jgi:hypothetical protein
VGIISLGGSSPLLGIYFNITYMGIKLLVPFQTVLIQKRLCVGCTSPLDKAKRLGKLSERRELVECKCRRRYVYNKEFNEYQRATFQEEQQFLRELNKKPLL